MSAVNIHLSYQRPLITAYRLLITDNCLGLSLDDASVGEGSEKWGTGTNFHIICPCYSSRSSENSSQSPIFLSLHPPTLTGLINGVACKRKSC